MGNKYYLAVDIGASSGRHILGWVEDGILKTQEVHRFKNSYSMQNGHNCWNHENLFDNIVEGMRRCGELGKAPVSVAVDTWGVDYVLLDENDNQIGDTVCYRDDRTEHIEKEAYKLVSEKELYSHAGIQWARFNTVYQLIAQKKECPEQLERAKALLFTPDYFHYRLSGVKSCEYTIASTGNLINAKSCDWDYELIDRFGLPREIFLPIVMPGSEIGTLSTEIAQRVGYNCKVYATMGHDTASAVVAVPTMKDTVYLSSGTWSLMGIELTEPNCTSEAQANNFTNEGGYDRRYRFLKNIMGLWMIQSVKREYDDKYGFNELCNLAEQASIDSVVDCNDDRFTAPKSMIKAIQDYCKEHNLDIPNTPGEIARVVYSSLSIYYAKTIKQIEEMTGKTYEYINIVGGGSQDEYLNKLTAKTTGKKVKAGPVEATAIGNLLGQMLGQGDVADLSAAREMVKRSFEVKSY